MTMKGGRVRCSWNPLHKKALWVGLLLIGGLLVMRGDNVEPLNRLRSSRARRAYRTGRAREHIMRAIEDVYNFVRRPENARIYTPHIADVVVRDPQHVRWNARTRGGIRVTWDGELVEDGPLRRLVWHWRERDTAVGMMAFQFTDIEREETMVEVTVNYANTSTPLKQIFSQFLSDPTAEANAVLGELKRVLENPTPEPVESVAERQGINQGGPGSGVNM